MRTFDIFPQFFPLQHIANAVASSIKRRQKEEDSIIEGNLWLYNKLQTVKPSKDVNRKALEKQYSKSRKNIPAKKRAAANPLPPGLGNLQGKVWDDRWHAPPSSC